MGKILANYISDKGLVSRRHKELKKVDMASKCL